MKENYKSLTSFNLYLSDVEGLDRLKLNKGQSRNEIIESLLPLVIKVAKKYARDENELLELIQEGNLGLIEAVDRFNTDNPLKFSTYAYYSIFRKITRYYRKDSAIPLSIYGDNKLDEIKKYIDQYVCTKGSYPTYDEISNAIKLSKKNIYNLLMIDLGIIDINEKCSHSILNYTPDLSKKINISDISESFDDMSIVDLIRSDDDVCDRVVSKECVKKLLEELRESLTDVEYDVLISNGVYNETLTKIATRHNVSREGARQIGLRARQKILHRINNDGE